MQIRVYNSRPDAETDKASDAHLHMVVREIVVSAGAQTRLTPAESISFNPYLYHDPKLEPDTGPALLGEVNQHTTENTDNRFNPPMGPAIEEAESPYRPAVQQYPAASDEDDGIP